LIAGDHRGFAHVGHVYPVVDAVDAVSSLDDILLADMFRPEAHRAHQVLDRSDCQLLRLPMCDQCLDVLRLEASYIQVAKPELLEVLRDHRKQSAPARLGRIRSVFVVITHFLELVRQVTHRLHLLMWKIVYFVSLHGVWVFR
jgi:hypothetical protein